MHYPKLHMLPDVTAVMTEGDILHTVIWGKERGKQRLLANYYTGYYFPRPSQELARADVRAHPRSRKEEEDGFISNSGVKTLELRKSPDTKKKQRKDNCKAEREATEET